ncbi:MAG: phosphate acetyltransferase [Candidatus Kapaibacterium sp.]
MKRDISDILPGFRRKASLLGKRIALPDALDPRTLRAARILADQGIAEPILIGNSEALLRVAETEGISIANLSLVAPGSGEGHSRRVETFYQLRQHKSITEEEAEKSLHDPLYTAGMMVHLGECDGCVAGSLSTTGDVLRAGIQTIGLQANVSTVSSFFLILFPDKVYAFADGGVVPNPTPEQLADIALMTAQNYKLLIDREPLVAFLSFSTKGSAEHADVAKVRQGFEIALKKNAGGVVMDGELQLDAAIVPEVAERKAPDSPLQGRANVLIFPDLDSGNIAYKLAQRMAGAVAIGPIVQGLAKPMFDLSRGCSVDDIVDLTAICALSSEQTV